ncbi:MAG: ATP-binding protein [Phycisphaerae bacterium]
MKKTVVIPSKLDAAREAERALLDEVARHAYSEESTFAIKLAVEEALNNAVKHGSGFDSSKKINLTFRVDPGEAVVTITDQGSGFDPAALPDPTTEENLQKPTGRGIMLMRAYMDEVRFNEKGNQVHLVKKNT